jgi:biopolymer transport protein TolR
MAFGRLERTQLPQPMSEINVTPLVDVMLVLVVIFIITAPLLASAIRLDLPKAAGTQAGDVPRFVTLSLDRAGGVFLNDKPVTTAQLAIELAATAKRNPDTEVQLRADQTVAYGKVVEVMGLAHQAGLSRIGFVAEPVGK